MKTMTIKYRRLVEFGSRHEATLFTRNCRGSSPGFAGINLGTIMSQKVISILQFLDGHNPHTRSFRHFVESSKQS